MKSPKLLLGILLFALGMLGVLSLLTLDVSFPPEAAAILEAQFTDTQIQLLIMLNPTILLIIAIVVGALLYDKMGLELPLIERLAGIKKDTDHLSIFKYGIPAGLLTGLLLSLIGFVFTPLLPEAFLELGEKIKPTLLNRFLYGGITEEILLRFGFMTFVVWGLSKLLRSQQAYVYWLGIVVSAVVFALGHFPVAYQAVESPSAVLLLYLLLGNTVGGLIFGWLYWKKGLESAMLAHIFAHVVMVAADSLLNL